MGICVANFHFKEGIPKVIEIEKKFNELTGLDVHLNARLELVDLPFSDREIVHKLHKDSQEWEALIHKFPAFEDRKQEEEKLNSLGYIYFECYDFGSVQLAIEYMTKHNVTLEYGINESGYFSESLIKTFHELGGRSYIDYNNLSEEEKIEEHHLEPYSPHEERWKKLKKWEDYNSFNRPKKKLIR